MEINLGAAEDLKELLCSSTAGGLLTRELSPKFLGTCLQGIKAQTAEAEIKGSWSSSLVSVYGFQLTAPINCRHTTRLNSHNRLSVLLVLHFSDFNEYGAFAVSICWLVYVSITSELSS